MSQFNFATDIAGLFGVLSPYSGEPHDTDVHGGGVAGSVDRCLTANAFEVLNSPFFSATGNSWARTGAVDEDAGALSLNHFYNPWTGENFLVPLLWPLAWDNARDRAASHWSGAIDLWNRDQLEGSSGAYHMLGQALHLLQDMSSPAHVHDEEHWIPSGPDDFEEWGKTHYPIPSEIVPTRAPLVPSGNLTLPGGRVVEAKSILGFMQSMALFTDTVSSFHGGNLPVLGGAPPESELKRMFPDDRLLWDWLDLRWRIEDVGLLGTDGVPNSDWWEVDGHEGYYHIRHAAGESGSLTPAVFEKTGVYVANPNSKTLLQIYGDVLYPKCVEYCAGLLQAFAQQVDQTPPTASARYGTGPDTSIYVTFSEDINDSTLTAASISVSGSVTLAHACALTFNHSTHELTIDPSYNFSYGETVTVIIGTGVKDLAGNGLDGNGDGVFGPAYQFSFVVGPRPTFTITSIAGSHGTISPCGQVSVSQGGSRAFTATADSEYVADTWYLDGSAVQTGGNQYTVTNVHSDRVLYVTFAQRPPNAITVTAPNAGGSYARGRKLYINWTWNGAIGQYVNIDLLKGGSLNTPIASSYPNSGYHTWDIPATQALGTDYRVRVSATTGDPSDQSDGDFEITTNRPPPSLIPISNLTQLQAMSEQWNSVNYPRDGYYVLTADIDARDTRNWNAGLGFKPIGSGYNDWFRGTFDGQGHTISGLYCKRPSEAYAALFAATMDKAVIRNLSLELKSFHAQGYLNRGGNGYGGVGGIAGENSGLIQNCQVTVNSADTMYVTNGYHCGGIVGENYHGTILNCAVVGTSSIQARGTSACDSVGGIAGVNSGLIRWCWVGPDVDIDADYRNSNGDEVGGIVGSNEGGRIWECESRARWIDGDVYVGGIVGYNGSGGEVIDCYFRSGAVHGSGIVGVVCGENDGGTVLRCYSVGSISGGSGDRGSLAGRNYSLIQDSYWDSGASSFPAVGGNSGTVSNCVGRTAAELMQQVSFTNWDFAGVWAVTNGVDFPIVRGVGAILSAPTGVAASTGLGDGVHVSWGPAPEATRYLVSRSDTLEGLKVGLSSTWLPGLSFVDATATPLTTFYYWVRAGTTPDGGRGSAFSSSATGSRTQPAVSVPQGVAASDGLAYQVVVQWSPVSGGGYYQVYRSATPGGAKVTLSPWQTNTTFADSSGAPSTTNYYYVRAAASSSGDRASDYSSPDAGWFIIPDVTDPSVSVTSAPALPIETQSVALNVQGSDDRGLRRIMVYWIDVVLHSNRWDNLTTSLTNLTQQAGPFAAGQEVTFWAVAEDNSGNLGETAHVALTVQAEGVTAPLPPTGPGKVRPNQVMQFTARGSTTSLGGAVEYQFNWQDGSVSAWGGTNGVHAWTNDGAYQVRVMARSQARTNRVSGWSDPLLVHVAVPPTITANPQSVVTNQGAVVSFSVSASGSLPLHYQWQRDGTNLVGNTRFSGLSSNVLTITGVQLGDAGGYRASVTNAGGDQVSLAAMLMVLVPPVVVAPPQGAATSVGSTVVFTVSATGSRPLEYQWQRDGMSLTNSGRISGVQSNVLSIYSVQMSDAGGYSVVIRNTAGCVTSAPPAVLNLTDTLPPSLWVSSHTDLQVVAVTPVTLAGMASDAGRGDGGVARVTVNGVRATNDTAVGSAVANWRRGVTLVAGTNRIVVAAADMVGNSTTNVIRIILDNVRPTVAITNPVPNSRPSNAVVDVIGTAKDNRRVTNVWVGVNAASFVSAGTQNHWTNWALPQQRLAPGTNVVRAYAVDAAGNLSQVATSRVVYVVSDRLVLRTNPPAGGTVSGVSGGQWLEINHAYTATAKSNGAAGFVFRGWTQATNGVNWTTSTVPALSFTMRSNLVLVAHFTDVRKPTLTMTNPPANSRLNNSVVNVMGTAKDNDRVTNVWVSLNGASFLPAGTQNHWTNWALMQQRLVPGTNLLRAYAADATGNPSQTVTNRVVYVASDRLVVRATGPVALSPNYSNAVLEVGKSYSMTATPGSGYVLSNWVGSVLGNTVLSSNAPKLNFLMRSNLVLQANVIPNPFIPAKGAYNGLFSETPRRQDRSGLFTLTLTDKGAYSGNLQAGTNRYSLSGQFDVAGRATKTVATPNGSWLVTLVLGLGSGAGQLTGTVGDGLWLATLAADRAVFDSRTNPAPYAGKYTLFIPGSDGGSLLPGGDGYGAVRVDAGGKVTLSGSLADGTALSQTVPLSGNGEWPLYVSFNSGKGSLLGWLLFASQPPTDLSGVLSWIKPAQPGAALYPLGFTNQVLATGARYVPPASPTTRVIYLTNGVVIFDGGNLPRPLTNAVLLTATNKFIDLSLSNKLSLSLTLSNGTFSGSVTPLGTTRADPLKGALFQNLDVGYGYFLGTNQSGSVWLRR